MDPMYQTIKAFYEAVVENPVVAGALLGVLRNVSGWIQKKYFEKGGQPYDPKVLGTTIIKYEVAINALIALVPPEHSSKVYPLVLLTDIIISAGRKLKNGIA